MRHDPRSARLTAVLTVGACLMFGAGFVYAQPAPPRPIDPVNDPVMSEILRRLDNPAVHARMQYPALVPEIISALKAGRIRPHWVPGRGGGYSETMNIYLPQQATIEWNTTTVVHEGTHALGYLSMRRPAGEVLAHRMTGDFVDAFWRVRGIKLPYALEEIDISVLRSWSDRQLAEYLVRRWPFDYPRGYKNSPYLFTHGPSPAWLVRWRRWNGGVRSAAAGAGIFMGAYVLKEALVGLEHRDAGRVKEALGQLKNPAFLGGALAFGAMNEALLAASRKFVPLRVGWEPAWIRRVASPSALGRAAASGLAMAAAGTVLSLATGESIREVVPTTAGYLGAAWVVEGAAFAALGAGPQGRVASVVYRLLKATAALYGGDRLAGVFRRLGRSRSGVAQELEGLRASSW
ncbi:MAG: hypothetical protein HYY16_13665 [Planctomycetes bacterium]|nr:hypothetical protein [Planctomycetota bacterium]